MAAAARNFDETSTTEQVTDGIDLAGKTALVTGASSGLGAETARALVLRGAAVTLAVRNLEAGEAVAASIRENTGLSAVDLLELDLTKPDQIRGAVKEFSAKHDRLDLLINNAGVMACPLERTERGWEMQFGTNHMGHFLFTCLLTPLLRAGAPARIVNLSSAGHRFAGVDFDDPNYEKRDYDKWEAYGQAKTANVLFSVELNARLAADGVTAFAVHPGGIMTALGRHLQESDIKDLMAKAPGNEGIRWKTVEAGAATSVWAATAPELDGRGGIYLEDCAVAEPKQRDEQEGGFESYAVDPENAARLWKLSEDLIGETFPLS